MNMKELSNREVVLDISTNLSRLGRFALEKNMERIKQFLAQTEEYLTELNGREVSPRFSKTLSKFNEIFNKLKSSKKIDKFWADDAFTYSNILMHRARMVE